MPRYVVLISGKRKSGKDFCSKILSDALGCSYKCAVIGVSHSLKEEYAMKHGLKYEELLTDSLYKEEHRAKMIIWGEAKRNSDPGYFCRAALSSAKNAVIAVISDCRRKSDMEVFKSLFSDRNVTTVRIEAREETRMKRGYKFVDGVDNTESECGLDDYKFDYIIKNDECVEDVSAVLQELATTIIGKLNEN